MNKPAKTSPKPPPAVTKPENVAAAAKDPWLIVPPSPIDGGNDIPVGFKIKPGMISKPGDPNTTATIVLKWKKEGAKEETIAAFALSKNVLQVIAKQGELHISTRIKIAFGSEKEIDGS